MSSREPLSWMVLEQFVLGELPPSRMAEVERELEHDAAARDIVMQIRADARTLPPLPVARPHAAGQSAWWSGLWRVRWLLVTAAATWLVMMLPESKPTPDAWRGVKGDAIEMALVREQDGSVALDPAVFSLRDRFKVKVTCARAEAPLAVVWVEQGGELSRPIDAQTIVCGNQVVLKGAFRLTELTPAEVCVGLATSAEDADALVSGSTPWDHDCVTLTPLR